METQIAFTYENPRQSVIDATHDAAHEAWKEAFPQFVIEFAAKATEPFSAETIRLAYTATPYLPQPAKWRAAGGVFQRLANAGKLRQVGWAISEQYGCPIRTYLRG